MDVRRGTRTWPGPARKALALPAAAIAFTIMTGSGMPAHAADGAPSTAITVVRSGIPKGFLLYESGATRKRFEKEIGPMSWRFSDLRDVPLLIDPCATARRTDVGRQAARTVTGRSVKWDGDYSEQLIVYRDETAARRAVEGLRSQLHRCGERNRQYFTYKTKPVRIGDEAFLVDVFQHATTMGGTVMRQGRTVAVYTLPYAQNWRESEYGVSQAGKMARKLERFNR
ncbi:hypothetical protein AB0F88_13915 [Streptosporangium sp. NPDC023963]|uniref:hypothetical protein n=1 Tax=Streptosporangium sp. NPDC023963 TaxID=3155608 RepID=UPI0034491D45